MSQETFFKRFHEYEAVRRQIFCRLADPGRTDGGCRDMPSRPWMDLRICCYYDMAEEGLPDAVVPIYEECLLLWDVTADRVLDDAWHNTLRRQHVLFRPLDKVLLEMQDEPECPEDPDIRAGSPLYLLTNTNRAYGAIYMAVPDVLKQIGKDMGTDFYILPSSIHECLILPDTDLADEEELNNLVSLVNRGWVSEKDVLADHVYYYDRLLQHVRSC